jgi:hypothetical protein
MIACLTMLAACTSLAVGQNYTATPNLPGVSGVTVYTGAPPGFDPVTASVDQLQEYGYPRRPDPNDVKAYANWLRAVSTTRITPDLVVTNRYHGPNHVISTGATIANTTNLKSGNWSGWALVGGSPVFDEVVGLWVVPSVGNQFKSFTGYSSEWVGIDGDCNCNDLIQDGTEHDWVGGRPKYNAWIEFIPQPELQIANFAVSPGDVIYAYSAVGTRNGKIVGLYYIANYNTRKSVSASLAMPKGDTFSGKSAEWIMERTQVNGSFHNSMPFYAFAYMDNAFAYRAGSNRAIAYSSQTNQNIGMYEGSTELSRSYAQDSDSVWFQWLNYF